MSEPIQILSLGAGVQSSTLALMAASGQVSRGVPFAAIFADTQAEPGSVYRWLDWLDRQIQTMLHPFPIYRVTAGSLETNGLLMRVTADGRKYARTDIPFFTLSANGHQGRVTNRGCTYDYKIRPILSKARALANVPRKRKEGNQIHVQQWIGISLDEVLRMKPSREWWAESVWPLIDMRMTRHDCIRWMEKNGFPKPPRSSCVFCPFHNAHEWRRLRDEEPEEFARAVRFEQDVQAAKASTANFASTPFLHRSCVPLADVDLTTEEENGQMNMFTNECEGMCGV